MTNINSQYAHPEALVNTAWVAEHLKDRNVRIIESNEDVLLYDTRFVLTKLLGFEKVRNYDGSWTEWGNMVRSPIEKP